jgi:hypothetical protein
MSGEEPDFFKDSSQPFIESLCELGGSSVPDVNSSNFVEETPVSGNGLASEDKDTMAVSQASVVPLLECATSSPRVHTSETLDVGNSVLSSQEIIEPDEQDDLLKQADGNNNVIQSLVDPRAEVARLCGTSMTALWHAESVQGSASADPDCQQESRAAGSTHVRPSPEYDLIPPSTSEQRTTDEATSEAPLGIRKLEQRCSLGGTPPFFVPHGSEDRIVQHTPSSEGLCLHVETCRLQVPLPPQELGDMAIQIQRALQEDSVADIPLPTPTVPPSTNSGITEEDSYGAPDGKRRPSQRIYVTPGKANWSGAPVKSQQRQPMGLERELKRASDHRSIEKSHKKKRTVQSVKSSATKSVEVKMKSRRASFEEQLVAADRPKDRQSLHKIREDKTVVCQPVDVHNTDVVTTQPVPETAPATSTTMHCSSNQWSSAGYDWMSMSQMWSGVAPWFWATSPYWMPFGYAQQSNPVVPPPPPPPPVGHSWQLVANQPPNTATEIESSLSTNK